jgi:hypothetical protein
MKWTEGLRRVWLVWCGLVAALMVLLFLMALANPYRDDSLLTGALAISIFGAILAYLPRLPWLAVDLWKWLADGFRSPPRE